MSLISWGSNPLIVPFVPTGTNAGVETVPCDVEIVPNLAFDFFDFLLTLKMGKLLKIEQLLRLHLITIPLELHQLIHILLFLMKKELMLLLLLQTKNLLEFCSIDLMEVPKITKN